MSIQEFSKDYDRLDSSQLQALYTILRNPDSKFDSVTVTLDSDHSPKMVTPLPDEHDLMQYL